MLYHWVACSSNPGIGGLFLAHVSACFMLLVILRNVKVFKSCVLGKAAACTCKFLSDPLVLDTVKHAVISLTQII